MVSGSTVQPSLNLKFLCTYKNSKTFLYILNDRSTKMTPTPSPCIMPFLVPGNTCVMGNARL